MRNSINIQRVFGWLFLILVLVSTSKLKGQVLAGWSSYAEVTTDYKIGLDSTDALAGKHSAYFTSAEGGYDSFLNIYQKVFADKYRGNRVRFSFFIRTKIEEEQGLALPWVRVDGTRYRNIKFDNMGLRPIYDETDWTLYDIVIDIPERSTVITFGVMLLGIGEGWTDNVYIEIVDNSVETTDEPSSPIKLTPEGLEKLLAEATDAPVNLDFEGN